MQSHILDFLGTTVHSKICSVLKMHSIRHLAIRISGTETPKVCQHARLDEYPKFSMKVCRFEVQQPNACVTALSLCVAVFGLKRVKYDLSPLFLDANVQ